MVDTGLTDYLAAKRAAMLPAHEHVRGHGVPEAVEPLEATATVAGRSGIREIQMRRFSVLSDSGPDFAGYDLGPSSPELLLGSLASCLAHTWLIHAALEEVPLETVRVIARARMQSASAAFPHPSLPIHPFDISYDAIVGSPAGIEELDRLHETVRSHCPILALMLLVGPVEGRVLPVEETR